MAKDCTKEAIKALDDYQAALACSGDLHAFELLYKRWHPRFLRFAYRLVGNKDLAQDIIQDAAITIAKNIGQLQDPTCFSSWAYTIIRRRAMDTLKKTIRHRKIKEEIENHPFPTISLDTDDILTLKQALTTLNKDDQILLTLFYLDDLNGPELSAAMNIPIGTLKSRLHAARAKVKKIYDTTNHGDKNE